MSDAQQFDELVSRTNEANTCMEWMDRWIGRGEQMAQLNWDCLTHDDGTHSILTNFPSRVLLFYASLSFSVPKERPVPLPLILSPP